jgi:hypothetical protein
MSNLTESELLIAYKLIGINPKTKPAPKNLKNSGLKENEQLNDKQLLEVSYKIAGISHD